MRLVGAVDRIRDGEAPCKKGCGDRPKQEWGEEAPGEEVGAREADDSNGGDGEVENERRWTHHLRGEPRERHKGEVARCPCVAHRGVEEGDQEETEREERVEEGRIHARIIGGRTRAVSSPRTGLSSRLMRTYRRGRRRGPPLLVITKEWQ